MERVGDMLGSSLTSFGGAGFGSIYPLALTEKIAEWKCSFYHG